MGNQAMSVLHEVTAELNATEILLEETRQILKMRLSHEESFYRGGVAALLKSVEARDEATGHHIERMALFSLEIAKNRGICNATTLKTIFFIALLHDIGKVGTRDDVLNKPGFLTDDEREHMKLHAAKGAEIVASMPGWEEISQGVRTHHEWWDGTGYPACCSGEEIPLEARIVAVADVFDAVTSLRPYRQPFPYFAARTHIERESGTHFDPEIVDAFLGVPEERWEVLRKVAEQMTPEILLQLPLSNE